MRPINRAILIDTVFSFTDRYTVEYLYNLTDEALYELVEQLEMADLN